MNSSCSERMSVEEVNICNQMMLEHEELLHGFEDAVLTVAEVVGESFYSKKMSGVLAEIPDDAFFCEWKTKSTEIDKGINYVEVIFAPEVGADKLLWLYESQILEDRTSRPIRRFDYTTSSFDSWE